MSEQTIDPRWRGTEHVFTEAEKIIHTDRNSAYGNAEDNFHYIALTWTAMLQARGVIDRKTFLTEGDVARMMVCLKMCRDANAPHTDNRVDGVGYIGCLERVEPTVRHIATATDVDEAMEMIGIKPAVYESSASCDRSPLAFAPESHPETPDPVR